MQHILGYTIANDITAPQKEQDLTVTIGKFFDTFAPLGPCSAACAAHITFYFVIHNFPLIH